MHTSENDAEESRRLRRAMRDLAALSTLPAVWESLGEEDVARSLAEVLLPTLALEFVYVRITGDAGASPIEVLHSFHPENQQQRLRSALADLLDRAPSRCPDVVPGLLGQEDLRLGVAGLGLGNECGVLVTGSRRADYPADQDRLLLSVAANQTTIVIRRSRAEAAVRESEKRLGAELTERLRFEQALKDADRRKDEFLATLAHELRNPLAPIRNAVQIFRATSPQSPDLEWVRDVIDRQVQQMTRLVDDLLDVSRITSGKIELRKERVPLAVIVTGAVEASRPLIERGGHSLNISLPSKTVYLEADTTRLTQVLSNLLNNAAKYTEPRGRIGLTAEPAGSSVEIRIQDSGIGIPQDMLLHIFEMFAQVDRSLERSQGGLGIGLTLVKRLVEMHSGTVSARSEGPGKGSEFIVSLPIAPEIKQNSPELANKDDTVPTTAKRRILVVDDNRDSAESLAMLLRLLGHEVQIAHDGLMAVEMATSYRPGVVLLDIGLPKLNGYEAGRRIREDRGKDVLLVALTGWGQEEDRRRSQEAGFDQHMTKPVDLDALQALLARS